MPLCVWGECDFHVNWLHVSRIRPTHWRLNDDFDINQQRRHLTRNIRIGVSVCVCVCSLNDDCSRVLVGYARGQMTMWDLTSGKLLRTITDAHSPGVAVLSVKFTDDKTVALMSDSGGSVFRLEFKRLIGLRTCDSQCLFSGSRGEVSRVTYSCS